MVLNTRRVEEVVRRTRELIMKGVSFWELRKKEKRVLKPHWLANMREKVEPGRYKRPTANNMLPDAKSILKDV